MCSSRGELALAIVVPNPLIPNKVTSGSVLGVKAPTNVVTRESYLEVLVVVMIGTSAVAIVAVFLFGRFSRDQTVYIELDD